MSTESSTAAMPGNPSRSLVIPVYGNEGSIPDLLAATAGIHEKLSGGLEVVFVVDVGESVELDRFRFELASAGAAAHHTPSVAVTGRGS